LRKFKLKNIFILKNFNIFILVQNIEYTILNKLLNYNILKFSSYKQYRINTLKNRALNLII
jgi:hypothetical protein